MKFFNDLTSETQLRIFESEPAILVGLDILFKSKYSAISVKKRIDATFNSLLEEVLKVQGPEMLKRYSLEELRQRKEKFFAEDRQVLKRWGFEKAMKTGVWERVRQDPSTGGIDLTRAGMKLEAKIDSRWSLPSNVFIGGGNDNLEGGNSREGIKFYITPAMLARFRDVPGVVARITAIEPLRDLDRFLEI